MEFVILTTITLAATASLLVAAVTTLILLSFLKIFFKIARLGCGLILLIFSISFVLDFLAFIIIF